MGKNTNRGRSYRSQVGQILGYEHLAIEKTLQQYEDLTPNEFRVLAVCHTLEELYGYFTQTDVKQWGQSNSHLLLLSLENKEYIYVDNEQRQGYFVRKIRCLTFRGKNAMTYYVRIMNSLLNKQTADYRNSLY